MAPKRKLKATPKKNTKSGDVLREFDAMMAEVGVLKEASSMQLSCDVVQFQERLSKALQIHLDPPSILEDAVQSFNKNLDDPARLKCFLSPVVIIVNNNQQTSLMNDSFIRVLISVPELQTRFMKALLKKLEQVSKDKENTAQLILKQFCWISKLQEPQILAEEYMKTINTITSPSSSSSCTSCMLACLPSIFPESCHPLLSHQLVSLMDSHGHLIISIIDALDALHVPTVCLNQLKQVLMAQLSERIEHLAILLPCLLSHTSAQEAPSVIEHIRRKITSLTPSSHKQTDQTDLLLDKLHLVLHVNKALAVAWIKNIETCNRNKNSSNTSKSIGVVDWLLLLLLHRDNTHGLRKVVEGVVKKMTSDATIIQQSISSSPHLWQGLFSSLMGVCQSCQPSPFSSAIYLSAFTHFSSYFRQEIVAGLVGEMGGSSTEGSLDTLISLSLHSLITPYAPILYSMLDHVDNLKTSQVKKLYRILARLACSNSGAPTSVKQDALFIMIKKQLFSGVARYQQIGVMGGLMIVQSVSLQSSASASEHKATDNTFQQLIEMLNMIELNAAKSATLLALYFEELATLVKSKCLDKKVEAWLYERVMNRFQNDYVVDVLSLQETNDTSGDHKSDRSDKKLVWSLQQGLDAMASDETAIALNLLPLLSIHLTAPAATGRCGGGGSGGGGSGGSDSGGGGGDGCQKGACIISMISCFRLLHSLQHSHHQHMEDIEALLGCVIKAPKLLLESETTISRQSDARKQALCHSVLLCINWFRELLNGFSREDDGEMRVKVVSRLKSLPSMQQLLLHMLQELTEHRALASSAHNMIECNNDVTGWNVLVLQSVEKKAKKKVSKSKAKKKKKKDEDKEEEEEEEEDVGGDDDDISLSNHTPQQQDKAIGKTCNINNFFRELDVDVMHILTYTNLCSKKEKSELELGGRELCLLLSDLHSKLTYLFANHNNASFFKSRAVEKSRDTHREVGASEVAVVVMQLLPHLCRYLEACAHFLQEAATTDDDDDTCGEVDLEDFKCISSCVSFIINIITLFFQWSSREDRATLKSGLTAVADRMESAVGADATVDELFSTVFEYFSKFANSLFTSTSKQQSSASPTSSSPASSSPCHLSIVVACELTVLMMILADNNASLLHRTSDRSVCCLKMSWKEEVDNKVTSTAVNKLLNVALTQSSNINTLYSQLLSALQQSLFPTITPGTFSVFYKSLLLHLVRWSRLLLKEDKMTQLSGWSTVVKHFHSLILVVKSHDSSANLIAALKYAQQFLNEFLKDCMPLVDQLLTSHKEQVHNMLKSLQTSTRILQHLCTHSKLRKDTGQTRQVPVLRRTMERLLQRVKKALHLNSCLHAFWLGNLKNRDLKGDEILSQAPPSMKDKDDDEDDEEDSEDDDINEENNSGDNDGADNNDDGDDNDVGAGGDDNDIGAGASEDVDYLFKESDCSDNNGDGDNDNDDEDDDNEDDEKRSKAVSSHSSRDDDEIKGVSVLNEVGGENEVDGVSGLNETGGADCRKEHSRKRKRSDVGRKSLNNTSISTAF